MSRIKPILSASKSMPPIPPATEALDPIGELVVDVASGHHRLFAIGSRPILDAVEDSLLTFTQSPLIVFAGTPAGALWGFLGYSGSHSKASFE